jgi:hypothetical protein
MLVRRVVLGVVLAAGLAGAAQAEVIHLNFREVTGASVNYQNFGPNVYLPDQLAFRAAADSQDYDFHFTYDTAGVGPSYGLALVSGRVGSFTDFSAFTASLTFSPSSQLFLKLERTQTAGSSFYMSGAYFLMQDNDGDIAATIPASVNLAALDQATASFEIRRNGGVGQGYNNIGFGRFEGTFGPLVVDPGPGPVPEPTSWALMILGFGAAGAVLRARRPNRGMGAPRAA